MELGIDQVGCVRDKLSFQSHISSLGPALLPGEAWAVAMARQSLNLPSRILLILAGLAGLARELSAVLLTVKNK